MPKKPSVKDGDRFYRLIVLATFMKVVGTRQKRGRTYPRRERYAIVECECGERLEVTVCNLRTGNTRSCGCSPRKNPEHRPPKTINHGLSTHPLYSVWTGMRQRCQNPNNGGYRNYGDRGIQVCPEWEDPEVFIAWGTQTGYKSGLTLDRIDNDGDYEPGNCRWATPYQQAQNTQKAARVAAFGETKTYRAWSRDPRCVVPWHVLRYRIVEQGMIPEDAITKR